MGIMVSFIILTIVYCIVNSKFFMKKELYLIADSYRPNEAFTNRLLALTKGYAENGIQTSLIFVFPSPNRDKINFTIDNVKFMYLWKDSDLSYPKFFLILLPLLRLLVVLKHSIPAIVYNLHTFLFFLLLRPDVKIYHDRTEIPTLYGFSNDFYGRFKYYIYKKTCKYLSGGIFVICRSLSNYFIDNFGICKNKVHVVNMIVDSTKFQRDFFKEPNLYISYCGTISEYKDGVNILITAFKEFHSSYPQYKLKLIGPFQDSIVKERILKLIKDLELVDSVVLTGVVSSEKIPDLLYDSKILVLARPDNLQAKYGFPSKLGEYLMTGIPVLLTRVGDIDLFLKDGESVFFASPDSVEELVVKMKWIVDNYKKAKDVSSRGKTIALENFNYLIESKKIINVIFGD